MKKITNSRNDITNCCQFTGCSLMTSQRIKTKPFEHDKDFPSAGSQGNYL